MRNLRMRIHRASLLGLIAAALSISTQAQTAIPASAALPVSAADTTKPGFLWRIHQSAVSLPNTLARAEAQLAGQRGENFADPFGQGGADDVAAAPNPATAPIEFVVSTVINFDQNGAERGSILGDTQMPGIPGTDFSTDTFAVEVLTWLELPAGEIVMGVNSDDGFRVTIGGANPTDRFGVNVGEYDSTRGAADSIFRFNIPQAGLYAARLIYFEGGSDASVEWWTQLPDSTKVLINNSAEGGIKAYRAILGSAAAAVLSRISPGIGESGIAPNAPVQIELTEGSTVIDTASVKVTVDGTPVTATPTKTGNVISVRHVPTSLYAPSSTHQVAVVFTEGTITKTNAWSFTVASYGTLPATAKLTPDTTKPGFVWNIFANTDNQTTSNQRAEDALAGLLKDFDGNLLLNNADPNAQGVALAPAAVPALPNAPLQFEIPGVINLAQNAADDAENMNGNFTPDLQMPGIPALDGTDGIAAEALAFLELPAGVVTMGVNSDDGFRTTAGNPQDVFQAIRLGEFDGGRGTADTIFSFVVQEAGVYAFRTLWQEGTEGANIEWFTVKEDGSKVLVNDTANGGVRAYRAIVGGTQPYVKTVSPTHINRIANQSSTSLTITIADGTNPLDDNSIVLKLNGEVIVPTKVRSGSTVTLTHTPTTLALPYEENTAEITFQNAAGTHTRAQQWKFRNLKNLVFPTPVITENFDSYEEGTVPTDWVARNFTDTRTPGEDLDDLNSDSYKGWIVVSRDRLDALKGRIYASVAPGQFVNGVEVTSMGEGNVLYAESDVRGGNQVLFITTKPFDLSTVTNVVLSFSSAYEQNQDNIGALEYSVDGGSNWLPLLYYIDALDSGGDIDFRADGTIDAVSTLTSPNADTANWTDGGVAKGDKYGDALLAPITSALDVYIAPRHNDNSTIDKLVEAVRLPEAGLKSDVRLRFAYIGTGSWYWGVDNLAFYEGPAPFVTPPTGDTELTVTKNAAGQISLSWTGTGTLESTAALGTTWSPHGSQANPQTVTADGTARFFRVRM
jgi:hypothetical protein